MAPGGSFAIRRFGPAYLRRLVPEFPSIHHLSLRNAQELSVLTEMAMFTESQPFRSFVSVPDSLSLLPVLQCTRHLLTSRGLTLGYHVFFKSLEMWASDELCLTRSEKWRPNDVSGEENYSSFLCRGH